VLPDPDAGEIRELAERILQRPEYADWHPDDLIIRLLQWLQQLFKTQPELAFAIVGLLTVVFAVIVAHLTWTVRRDLATRVRDDSDANVDAEPRFLERAEDLAGRGRFLDAARTVQLAVIQKLVRGGAVELGRADPNSILRRRLQRAQLGSDTRTELVSLVARLERCWFRDRAEDADLYTAWLHAYTRLGAEIPAP